MPEPFDFGSEYRRDSRVSQIDEILAIWSHRLYILISQIDNMEGAWTISTTSSSAC